MLTSIRRHWLVTLLVGLVVLVLIAFVGVRSYVNSERMRNLVATKLTALVGTNVEVDQVDRSAGNRRA